MIARILTAALGLLMASLIPTIIYYESLSDVDLWSSFELYFMYGGAFTFAAAGILLITRAIKGIE